MFYLFIFSIICFVCLIFIFIFGRINTSVFETKTETIKKGTITVDNLVVNYDVLIDESIVINKVFYFSKVNNDFFYSNDIRDKLDDCQVEYITTNVIKTLEK